MTGISGRQFSRKRDYDPIPISEFVPQNVPGFLERAQLEAARAKEYLASKGFPVTPEVDLPRGGFLSLDLHVMRAEGRDSFPHIAARIVVAVARMNASDAEMRLNAAFDLGEAVTLNRVYRLETERRRVIGGKSKRRKWAELLAERIDRWEDIPDSYARMEIDTLEADLRVYRDGDDVICKIEGVAESTLKRSSFEKRYLNRAKRGQQRR